MIISSNFNRFFHGVLLKEIKDCKTINVPDLGKLRVSALSIITIKSLLKVACPYWPTDYSTMVQSPWGIKYHPKISTRAIESKTLCDFIDWVILIAGESGCTLAHVEEEWKRIIDGIR